MLLDTRSHEDELVAAESNASTFQLRQSELARTEEVENFFKCGYLIG